MSSQQPQAMKHTHIGRREFIKAAGAAAGITYIQGCATPPGGRSAAGEGYSVAILGDTHYDAEPESVYHSHYDESNKWAKIQHAEFLRNGEVLPFERSFGRSVVFRDLSARLFPEQGFKIA